MSSRSLADLERGTSQMAGRALEACANDPWMIDNGVTVLVTCTSRTPTEQALLYAQGRTREQLDKVGLTDIQPRAGAIVTRAPPGSSAHNAMDEFGRPAAKALDIVPLRYGKPIWGTSGDGIDDDPSDDATDDREAWDRVAQHFKAAGFKWFGEKDAPFKEEAHFQDPSWRP